MVLKTILDFFRKISDNTAEYVIFIKFNIALQLKILLNSQDMVLTFQSTYLYSCFYHYLMTIQINLFSVYACHYLNFSSPWLITNKLIVEILCFDRKKT